MARRAGTLRRLVGSLLGRRLVPRPGGLALGPQQRLPRELDELRHGDRVDLPEDAAVEQMRQLLENFSPALGRATALLDERGLK